MPRPNKYADLILEPVWVSWCRARRKLLESIVRVHGREPLYIKVLFESFKNVADEDIASLIEVIDATLRLDD